MKQIKIFAAIVVAAVALSSCSSYSYTSRVTSVDRQEIIGTSMVVNVRPDFTKRINTESHRCKTLAEAKEEARYLAVTDNKCDVIVDPIYKIEHRSRTYKAYLTGFAGYYQNPRTLYEDIQMYKDVKKEDIEKYLILKDPSILGLMHPAGPSEVVNIFDGKVMPGCPDQPKESKSAPAPAPAPSSKRR